MKALAKSIGIFVLAALSTGLTNYFIPSKVYVVNNEQIVVKSSVQETVPEAYATGWVKDDTAVNVVVKGMSIKEFDETPAGQISADDLPQHIYLWEFYKLVTGHLPPSHNQGQLGSCVGHGTARAIENTLAAEIANGQRFILHDVSEESLYGGSRVEVGGGQIRGDGSVGAWAAKFAKDYGVLFKIKYPEEDLTSYDLNRCRQWGETGVPASLEKTAKEYPVKDTALITSWSDAKKALSQGYGIAVCSDQGFTMQRDSKGVCYPQGTWPHCMSIDGFYVDTNGKEFAHITNSWGPNAHTGPVGFGNPNTDGFWTDSKVVNRMLSQRDSWAFSGVKGFPAKKLNWIHVKPQDQRKNKWQVAADALLAL